MLAQRGADLVDVKAQPKPKTQRTREDSEPPRAAKSGKRRLSFHEKHALETLPAQIAGLQVDLRRLQDQLSDPALYARDRQAFAKATESLGAMQVRLAAAEERWLELELLREEIEGV
jgi:ATP-binding cassette subfamily F protein uup